MKTKLFFFIFLLFAAVASFSQSYEDFKKGKFPKFNAQVSSSVNFTSSTLPIVVINTNGQTIVDEPKIIAHMGIIHNGWGATNNITDPFNAYNNNIGIEIRGTSSQFYPKKSYGFETLDANNVEKNYPLLGMPTQSDWTLIATAFDKTILRNSLMYKLWGKLGYYSPRTVLCEVVLNGDYIGVYTLTEKIKRNTNRVNISKLENADTTSKISGGYIVAGDWLKDTDVNFWHSPYSNSNTSKAYIVEYPKAADLHPKQYDYIKQYFLDFETTLLGNNYKDSVSGFRQYIDESTFIDYFLIQEFSKNIDAYMASMYFHKDRNGKLKLGPTWDFDSALAYDGTQVECSEIDLTSGWMFRGSHCLSSLAHFWWERFLTDCKYTSKLRARYQALRQNQLSNSSVNSVIDSLANVLLIPQSRNWERWGMTFLGTSTIDYSNEIVLMKNWIAQRLAWMDANIATIDNFEPTLVSNPNPPNNSIVTLTTNTPPSGSTVLWEWQLPDNQIGSYNSGTANSLSILPKNDITYRTKFISSDGYCNTYYSNPISFSNTSLCNSTINMTDNLIFPATPSAIYKSVNEIVASGDVNNQVKAKFQSEKSILFLPGFSASAGSVTTAEIKNCN